MTSPYLCLLGAYRDEATYQIDICEAESRRVGRRIRVIPDTLHGKPMRDMLAALRQEVLVHAVNQTSQGRKKSVTNYRRQRKCIRLSRFCFTSPIVQRSCEDQIGIRIGYIRL
jgi:hypothetical protein